VWRHPIGGEVSGYNFAAYSVGQTGEGGYANSDNSIQPRCPSSYQLRASEFPSIESPIMFRNTAGPARLLEKKLNTPIACSLLVNGLLLPVTESVYCCLFIVYRVINLFCKDPVNNNAN